MYYVVDDTLIIFEGTYTECVEYRDSLDFADEVKILPADEVEIDTGMIGIYDAALDEDDYYDPSNDDADADSNIDWFTHITGV